MKEGLKLWKRLFKNFRTQPWREILNPVMAEEDIEFADMIVGDFEDTYDNLPLKTFLGYQFYHDFCQESLTIQWR